jgi:hypothetical protein
LNVFSNLFPSILLFVCFAVPGTLPAQKFYTYVGSVGTDHVVIAWGTTAGDNTIGRSSKSHGTAEVVVGPERLTVSDQNWVKVTGLAPDTKYPYEVQLKGRRIGEGEIRTWPVKADRMRFFVVGDFGSGDKHQYRIAAAMVKELQKHDGDNPVRFVLTTGDNIYGRFGITLRFRDTGDDDDEWDSK